MEKRANVIINEDFWQRFRKACIDHKMTASEAIRQLMEQQLQRWEIAKQFRKEDFPE